MSKRIRRTATCACGQPKQSRSQFCGSCAGNQPKEAVTVAVDSFEQSGDKATVTKVVDQRVRTLADLIRVCEIDTDVWEIERWVANKWEMGWKDADQEAHSKELFQVKAWLKKISAGTKTLMLLREGLVADLRAELKGQPEPPVRHRFVDGGWLFEFAPFDLHLGKYSWDEETVTNYDSNIAADLFNASLDFLMQQAMKLTGGKIEQILAVIGNDVSHVDTKRAQTTAGTSMDYDSRYIKVYRRIVQTHRHAIDTLRQIAPVVVKVVPGNHDELTSFHLGELLATRYENDKYVQVDNNAHLRKYHEFGINLFGFTHGDAERVSELPLMMAREKPEAWARCTSREWHIGHKHISEKWEQKSRLEQDLFSDKGIRVRRLTSLSAHDAWHTKHGYMDRRASEGFVFHKTAGFTSHLSFNIDHFSGKALVV